MKLTHNVFVVQLTLTFKRWRKFSFLSSSTCCRRIFALPYIPAQLSAQPQDLCITVSAVSPEQVDVVILCCCVGCWITRVMWELMSPLHPTSFCHLLQHLQQLTQLKTTVLKTLTQFTSIAWLHQLAVGCRDVFVGQNPETKLHFSTCSSVVPKSNGFLVKCLK